MSVSPEHAREELAKAALDARRKAARRTALIFGGIALAVYVGFLVSGVLLK